MTLPPQQRAVPSASTAQEWSSPPVTATAPVTPVTWTGTLLPAFVPMPSWPSVLSPQHHTDPSATTAQVWLAPAPIETMSVSPLTGTAELLTTGAPLPSWP